MPPISYDNGAIARYHELEVSISEQQLMEVLVYQAKLRNQGIYPINPMASIEDLEHYYAKVVQDFNMGYSRDGVQKPKSSMATQYVKTSLYELAGHVSWDYKQLLRINRSRITSNEELNRALSRIGYFEEGIALAGSAGDVSLTSVSTTGTNSTAASIEFNTASIANMNTTLMGMVGQLISANIDPKQYPLKFGVTSDVYTNMLGRLDTYQNRNGVQYINQVLMDIGGPGSGIFWSDLLGGTASIKKGQNALTFTSGTNNACLFTVDPQFYEIVTSPLTQLTDGVSPLTGQTINFEEVFVPIYKQKEAIIYSGTVANA